MITAGKYFKPEQSFCNSCRFLLLPGAKLTCLTLGADLEAVCGLPTLLRVSGVQRSLQLCSCPVQEMPWEP